MSYHITDLDTFNSNVSLFREAHWMPCGDKVVVAAMCTSDDAHHCWCNIPNVTTLPDPLRNQPVGSTLAAQLAPYNIVSTDTTFDAIDKLSQVNPSFRFDFQ